METINTTREENIERIVRNIIFLLDKYDAQIKILDARIDYHKVYGTQEDVDICVARKRLYETVANELADVTIPVERTRIIRPLNAWEEKIVSVEWMTIGDYISRFDVRAL